MSLSQRPKGKVSKHEDMGLSRERHENPGSGASRQKGGGRRAGETFGRANVGGSWLRPWGLLATEASTHLVLCTSLHPPYVSVMENRSTLQLVAKTGNLGVTYKILPSPSPLSYVVSLGTLAEKSEVG